MSLQGSLDTFALPDVLVLLASTKKTGELHVAGNRSADPARMPELQGRLWLDAGRLVGADVPRAAEAADAVFELLRLVEGTFSFGAGTAPAPWAPAEIEPVLGEAQARLAEWREIERVVPSLDARLELNPEPPTAHLSMRADQWRLVVAVAGGTTVEDTIERLGLAELPGCRAVKEMLESGFVRLPTDGDGSTDELVEEPEPLPRIRGRRNEKPAVEEEITFWSGGAEEDEPGLVSAFADLARDEAPVLEIVPDEPEAPVVEQPAVEEERAADPVAEALPDWKTDLGGAADLDAIANLPRRSRPALVGTADDEAETEPTDELIDGEEPLNRGLLLKFLSSVRN